MGYLLVILGMFVALLGNSRPHPFRTNEENKNVIKYNVILIFTGLFISSIGLIWIQ